MKKVLKKKNQPMSEYTVYSKRNCSYCVRAIELLESKGLTHDVKKIDEDQRDGMFFSEFYTTKSIFVHAAINYMNSGKSSWFKKMLLGLKSKLR